MKNSIMNCEKIIGTFVEGYGFYMGRINDQYYFAGDNKCKMDWYKASKFAEESGYRLPLKKEIIALDYIKDNQKYWCKDESWYNPYQDESYSAWIYCSETETFDCDCKDQEYFVLIIKTVQA